MPMTERFAVVHRDFPAFSGKETFHEFRRASACSRPGNPRQRDSRRNADGSAANVDNFDRPQRIGVAIGLFMGAMKGGDELDACCHAQLIGLPDVANIESVFKSLLSFRKTFF